MGKTDESGDYMDINGFVRVGDRNIRITPDHGSEERRAMLRTAFYRNRERYRKAKANGDTAECCRLRGNAQRIRQLLHMEYGEDIDG